MKVISCFHYVHSSYSLHPCFYDQNRSKLNNLWVKIKINLMCSSLMRLNTQRVKGKIAVNINDYAPKKTGEQFSINQNILKTNCISRQHPLIFLTRPHTHSLPMLDACGRTENRSAHKCISKHQYHISCGLYFQAKVQSLTLFYLYAIVWSNRHVLSDSSQTWTSTAWLPTHIKINYSVTQMFCYNLWNRSKNVVLQQVHICMFLITIAAIDNQSLYESQQAAFKEYAVS